MAATVLKTVTGGAGILFSFPIQVIIMLAQGVMVARFASKDSRYTKADYFRLGLYSGLWTVLLNLALTVAVAAVMVGATLGAAIAALPPLIVTFLAPLIFDITLPGLGAWLYGRYGGKKLIAALAGVGCISLVIFGGLLAILLAVLANYGIKLLGG